MLTIEERFDQFSIFCQSFLKRSHINKSSSKPLSQSNENGHFIQKQRQNNSSKKRAFNNIKDKEASVSFDDPWNRKANIKRKKLEDEKERMKDALYHRLQMKINGFKKLRNQKKMAKKRIDRESKKDRKRKVISSEKNLKKNQLKLNSGKISDATSKGEEKIIFSKFDLIKRKETNDFTTKRGKLKKTLKEIKKEENLVQKLIKKGKVEEAENLQEAKKWNNAFKKIEGIKVKDDTKLVEKSIKKLDKEKIRHAKKWQERREVTEKLQTARQEKRQRNIEKKKEEKKERRLKRLKKKGRIFNLN